VHLATLQFCCTSDHCDGMPGSQAIQTWLLVHVRRFLDSRDALMAWVELGENRGPSSSGAYAWSLRQRSADSTG
jgi:hypothetical protein